MDQALFFSLAVACAVANAGPACSSAKVELAPGETGSFVVSGDEPYLDMEEGDAHILDVTPMPGGLFVVDVHCLASSPQPCKGILHGCGAPTHAEACSSGNS